MIEVSYHSCGAAKSAWVSVESVARRETTGGCISMHKPSGAPMVRKLPGCFDYFPAMLNVANIIERGTPKLTPGWKARANAWDAKRMAEFMAECDKTPLFA